MARPQRKIDWTEGDTGDMEYLVGKENGQVRCIVMLKTYLRTNNIGNTPCYFSIHFEDNQVIVRTYPVTALNAHGNGIVPKDTMNLIKEKIKVLCTIEYYETSREAARSNRTLDYIKGLDKQLLFSILIKEGYVTVA